VEPGTRVATQDRIILDLIRKAGLKSTTTSLCFSLAMQVINEYEIGFSIKSDEKPGRRKQMVA